MKIFKFIAYIIILLIGVILGGYLFSRSLPRSFIALHRCEETCFKSNELAGILSSVGIQTIGGKLPLVMYETDKTLVFDIQYPYPPDKIHYLVVPKRDVKDAGELTEEDKEYLSDNYGVMGKIVREGNYKKYRIVTNGPGYQEVNYLHFHLVIDRDQK